MSVETASSSQEDLVAVREKHESRSHDLEIIEQKIENAKSIIAMIVVVAMIAVICGASANAPWTSYVRHVMVGLVTGSITYICPLQEERDRIGAGLEQEKEQLSKAGSAPSCSAPKDGPVTCDRSRNSFGYDSSIVIRQQHYLDDHIELQ